MARDPRGPVVRDLHRRAQNVVALASRRAAGPIIDIDSGRLQSSIHYEIQERPTGPIAVIKSDAVAYDKKTGAVRPYGGRPFSYPAYHDQTGRPWLSGALRAAMLVPGEAV